MRLLDGLLALSLLCCAMVAQGGTSGESGSGVPGGQATSAPASAELRSRVRRLLDQEQSQLELPDARGGIGETRSPSTSSDRVAPGRRGTTTAPRSLFGGGSFSIAVPVLWVGAGLAVLCLLVIIARNLGVGAGAPRSAAAKTATPVRTVAGAVEAVAAELAEYERLAQRGDFAGAIHALVQHAERAFVEVAGALPLHATAREVVRRARSRSMAHGELAKLVRTFEVVHFGGGPADRALYDLSRAQLDQWRGACRPQV